MGELLEYLVPIIVGAVYLLSQFFSKGSQKDDPAPGHRPGRPDPEILAREQEIRDQIRRKIQERRQATDEPAAAHSANPQAEPQQQAPKPRIEPEPVVMPRQPSVSPAPTSTYETLMEAQLRRIEATKAQAAALQKRVASPGASGQCASDPKPTLGALQSSLRKSLKNPLLARRAVIWKEILEAPMALRTSADR
jgi:hypothetical protein